MNCWICSIIKKRGLTFLAGLIFALLCFVGLNLAMKPVSSSEYCGSKCHEMTTAYQSWELTIHGANNKGIRVECIDCHLPPKEKYFTPGLIAIWAAMALAILGSDGTKSSMPGSISSTGKSSRQ